MAGCSAFKEDCSQDVLYHLGSLLHLRYLQLESTTVRLLREVRYLIFLQTLDIGTCDELPEEVGLLTQLVCLRVGGYMKTSVPAGLIGKLTSLQELWLCCNDEDGTMQFVKELGLLRELKVLQAWIHIGVRRESIQSAFLESLGHLHNIRELQISCSGYQAPDGIMNRDAGWVSCRHLRFLRLDCFEFSGLPAWINSSLAPYVSYLDMHVVVVKDQDMETLAKLPELSCLVLHSNSDTKSVVRINIRTDGVVYFRKLRFLKIYGSSIWFDLCGSECSSSRLASCNTMMPSLESLEFDVHVRSLKDENLHLGFDKLLGFQNLGTSSLQRVTVKVNCGGASTWDVEEAEAALKHAAAVHPKHPTLLINKVE